MRSFYRWRNTHQTRRSEVALGSAINSHFLLRPIKRRLYLRA